MTDGAVAAPVAALLPPPGSDFYYASLYAAPAARTRVRLLEALRQEIADIEIECSDRGVAHVKLAWWRDELGRLEQGTPRHPRTRALLPAPDAAGRIVAAARALVDGIDDNLRPQTLPDGAAVRRHVAAIHGPMLMLTSEIMAAPREPADTPMSAVAALAVEVECAYALLGLRRHRAAGVLYLGADALERHGLHGDALREARERDRTAALLDAELSRIDTALAAGVSALPRALRRRHRLPVTLAQIQRRAIALTRGDGCRVFERRVEPTPVHKLWLAWRTARLG
ncbi:MAG: squalene/phytoene synthase family protein [Gammaproteobacteria bacterium]